MYNREFFHNIYNGVKFMLMLFILLPMFFIVISEKVLILKSVLLKSDSYPPKNFLSLASMMALQELWKVPFISY